MPAAAGADTISLIQLMLALTELILPAPPPPRTIEFHIDPNELRREALSKHTHHRRSTDDLASW